ncbi:hypothetical protein [Lacticaseibacillus absianus]|uniref:hypothetical protein n=1 Tax=Lacticaseibacillus absianus TaxID=2729623 RepID=UPI0015CB3647|nr:hypothetical protein [Lacticaseibacillus absianus]
MKKALIGICLMLILAGCGQSSSNNSKSKHSTTSTTSKKIVNSGHLSIDGTTIEASVEDQYGVYVKGKWLPDSKVSYTDASKQNESETTYASSDGNFSFYIVAGSGPAKLSIKAVHGHKFKTATVTVLPKKLTPEQAASSSAASSKASSIAAAQAASESSDAVASSRAEEASSKAEAASSSASAAAAASSKKAASQENNLVYGAFKRSAMSEYLSDLKKNSAGFYQGTVGMLKVTFGITNSVINTVKMDLRKLPEDPNIDKAHIEELTTQWMLPNSAKIQTVNSKEFIYQSGDPLNRKYEVRQTVNGQGKITFIYVSRVE